MRSKPLQRGRSKSKPRVVDHAEYTEQEILAKRYWRMAATRGGCVMCRAFPLKPHERIGREPDLRRIEGHHVLAKRHLRKEGFGGRFWDTRNGMGLCSYHHHRHEHWLQRVPFDLIPDSAVEFAKELGLLPLLESEHRS